MDKKRGMTGNEAIPTVGIIIIRNGMVLLVKHGEAAGHLDGKYGLPAGRIEADESLKEAARRELKEETGLEVDLNDLILLSGVWFADVERKDGIKQFSLQVFFADKFCGQLGGSVETVPVWINIDSLDEYDLLPNVYDIVAKGVKNLRSRQ
jgi:8-oxo-dGTP pyrophosphatase MutT (NUDIX family)